MLITKCRKMFLYLGIQNEFENENYNFISKTYNSEKKKKKKKKKKINRKCL